MSRRRTTRPFAEELSQLLRERSLSIRSLAKMVGVGDDHLSRVLRGAREKKVTGDLARRVARALDLPDDYFAETRSAYVAEHLDDDPVLRDRTYDRLRLNRRDQFGE
jgi:transcriptional regulator with XRE-family HTH domain